ncbi:MAG: divalent-cation tolerance protein CutA [Rhodocyclaceae bacterium]|nr:MAG: divalent-cation tolerance protein CutA [Rhodocyclaceae bacterium]
MRPAWDKGFRGAAMADEFLLVLTTCPGHTIAAEIATAVIDQRLAACVNRIPGVKSWFRWQGQLQQEEEVLLLIKTTRARLDQLETLIRALHPGEVPEIIALPITAGSAAYLQWISENTAP